MFNAIVRTQWKSSRAIVLMATVATFAVPLLSLRFATAGGGGNFLSAMAGWSVAYSASAAGVGLLLAILAWSQDHRGRHVYSLTLPIARSRYVLYRLGAGALFLIPPVVALAVSGELVARSGLIPVGLQAYPMALALRFALAAAVAYAIFFAINSATPRTAGIILGVIAAVFVLDLLLSTANVRFNLTSHIMDVIFATPGVLAVFGGRWMLIDV